MVVAVMDSRTGKRYVSVLEPMLGGSGGRPTCDGVEASGGFMTFLKNTPVEINEAEVPVKILRYDLVPDSGGAGKYRGGLANLLEFQVFDPNSSVTARNRDRTRFRAWGVQGGRAGMPSRFVVNPGTAKERELGNIDFAHLDPGDIVSIKTSGGAGRGNPLERDPQAVLADVRSGFVSLAAAEEQYGVVIKNGGVDREATGRLRAELGS